MQLFQTTTDEGLKNASATINGFGDGSTLAVVGLVVLTALLAILGSQTLYSYAVNASSTFARSLRYAVKGVATLLVLGTVAGPLLLFATLDTGTQLLAIQALGALVVGYVGLVVLGIVADYGWELVNRRHKQTTGQSLRERLASDDDDPEVAD